MPSLNNTRSPAPLVLRPAPLPPGSAPLPPGAVLIGTVDTLRTLWAQLLRAGSGVVVIRGIPVVGCLIAGAERLHPAPPGPLVLDGLPVLGTIEDLPRLRARFDLRAAVVSFPAAMSQPIARTRSLLGRLGIPESFVPTLSDLLAAPGWTPAAPSLFLHRPALDPCELIGRTPYGLDRKAVGRLLTGRRVLITGAGGSIGAELARVAAEFRPDMLLLMERAENALFEIDRQVSRAFPTVTRRAILHDVVDQRRTAELLDEFRPHVVFHAAAHKHVPIMEDHPSAAVTNNFFGTCSIVDSAVASGVEQFVMISTDKAVNPTSVMGATKRLAELYVRAVAQRPLRRAAAPRRAGRTRCSIVRFGNVLGSACSVLPIWSTQIADGGPITVTDPRMTRFFMTIPEAATLVVQAAALASVPLKRARGAATASAAPVFVLDMGEPVRILDLATRFVRAHGLEPRIRAETSLVPHALGPASLPPPGVPAIDIVFTGARPGEKLHEQLAYAAERLAPTAHPGINAWIDSAAESRRRIDPGAMVQALAAVRPGMDRASVVEVIRQFVPELVRPALDRAA